MNILDTIIAHKKKEVAERKQFCSVSELEKAPAFRRPVFSLAASLNDVSKTGIIAEFKRRSPSKGLINGTADVVSVTSAYTNYGASALSVLTDEPFFGGSTADLETARINSIPILRKDFMIDDYQVLEARAMGADVILLIAACLQPAEVRSMARLATGLGMEVLLEIHDETELDHIGDETGIIGINNRNLKDFSVDIDRSLALGEKIPAGKIKITESGIDNVETICTFKRAGFRGFLIGENFMKAPDPAIAFAAFVQQLKAKET